jgi:phosphatidylserine/phosphatidylglycerophosphate/cardiolipin synthase-like enzyme
MAVSASGALGGAIDWLDRGLGDRFTHALVAHHARRLQRAGSDVLAAPAGGWAADATPVRPGNRLDVLIDGDEMFASLLADLDGARDHVHITGWFMTPDFVLRHGSAPVVVRNLLAALAERLQLRVLLWAGSPAPLFTPSRGDVKQVAGVMRAAAPGLQLALDRHERPLHCHHEKLVVIDDRVAYVGGIDLTDLGGDRLDSRRHPSRAAVGWHDVATRIEGPGVQDVARHFAGRWAAVTGQPLADPAPSQPAGEVELQVVRTFPERMYGPGQRGQFGILESYLRALRSAQRFIYLESQYLWSPEIGEVLAGKLRNPPDDRFRIVAVLPAHPRGGGDDTRGLLGRLAQADAGGGRVLATTLAARDGRARDPIYVHAKVCVVDDRWLTVGSANLNEHSLFNDTEMNVVTHDPAVAAGTRLRLWSEHLELPEQELSGDPCDLIDRVWRPTAEQQLENVRRGLPLTHRLVQLPHVSRRSARLLGPLQGFMVDG